MPSTENAAPALPMAHTADLIELEPQPWAPGNDGVGKNRWFVYRPHYRGALSSEHHDDRNGDRLVRFASCEAAQRRADRLNHEQEQSVSTQYREADEAFIRAVLDGNGPDLPEVVFNELTAAVSQRPDSDITDEPGKLLDWTKRRLLARGKREEASELVARVKAVREA